MICSILSLGDIIQIGTAIITAIGIIVALLSNKNQLKIFNQQLKLNFFADYTKRYQEIILNFPENINEDVFDFTKLKDDDRTKTLRYMRAYFDLCSEEFHLHSNSLIDDSVWTVWEMGIKHALTKKAFIEAWKIIMTNTKYQVDFQNWVEKQIPKIDT